MKFMLIVKASRESEAGVMPTTEQLTEMGAFNEQMVKAGILRDGAGLHPTASAARVKFSGRDKRELVKGPFGGGPETFIAGFWVIEVGSREEAIGWAMRAPNPSPNQGEIEIRQFFEAEDFGEALTPELKAQEERFAAAIARQARH
jgi:hypothetical protein